MHEAEESMAVAAEVPEDLPEEEHALPPEVSAPSPQGTPPPPPDAWYAVEYDCRPSELASRGPAVGLLYRQRRRM
jgi:hypothetical protein